MGRTQSQAKGYADRMGRGLKEFATSPRHKRNRRTGYITGGAAAILGTILNMGNNKEEEEQQVR